MRETPNSLADLGISLEELGVSLADLGISLEELGVSLADLGISLEELGVSGRKSNSPLDSGVAQSVFVAL